MKTINKPKPVQKKKLIRLNAVGHTWVEVRAFGQQLISNLGEDIFFYQTKRELLFHVLKQIATISKDLKLEDDSIETACEVVIKYFRLNSVASIKHKSKRDDNTAIFCKEIIDIETVPSYIYRKLSYDVNKDLLTLSQLIKWYETQPCITKYIKDNVIPKPHEEKTIYEYYKRCVSERIEIVNYLLNGLKERALSKSKYNFGLSEALKYIQSFYDRPYHFAQPFAIHYFDWKQIDLAGHRVGEFYHEDAINMRKLYNSNKVQFYRKYFKHISIQQHFQNFDFYLAYLPIKNNRKLIFDELKRLFKARRWLSFYALALPQVEGLFSEMCLAVSPERDFSHQALSQKVNSVRPFHSINDSSYFDYYQYHIPIQRNQFSHTGYGKDFKLNSFDLLVDLSHLLKTFYDLDHPIVKIKKLHTSKNFQDFISIKDFADYFKLLIDLKSSQGKEISIDVGKFEKEFLCRECSIEFTCRTMIQEMPKKLNEVIGSLNTNFKAIGLPISLEEMNQPQIDALLKDEKQLEIVQHCLWLKSEAIEELENYFVFISNQDKLLPSLEGSIKKELNVLWGEHKKNLKHIAYIKSVFIANSI